MFVSNFINECVLSGKDTPDAICKEAKARLKRVEETLHKIENLRVLQSDLRKVLREVGGDKYRRKRKSTIVSNDFSMPINNFDDVMKKMSKDICDYIDNNKAGVRAWDILMAVASPEQNKEVYHCIKTLEEHGILKRNEEDFKRLICKGDEWDKRSKFEEAPKESVQSRSGQGSIQKD